LYCVGFLLLFRDVVLACVLEMEFINVNCTIFDRRNKPLVCFFYVYDDSLNVIGCVNWGCWMKKFIYFVSFIIDILDLCLKLHDKLSSISQRKSHRKLFYDSTFMNFSTILNIKNLKWPLLLANKKSSFSMVKSRSK
jgi:hypothetical protein